MSNNTRVSIELNEPLTRYLDILIETGCYGTDRQEACERIVAQHIEAIVVNPCPSPAGEAIYGIMSDLLGNEAPEGQ